MAVARKTRADTMLMPACFWREWMSYDPSSGIFTWIKSPRNQKGILHSPVGHVDINGYVIITVCGYTVLAHRLVWFRSYGEWPTQIDHRNGVKTDNRLVNLRIASGAENCANRDLRPDNTSGVKGVHWVSRVAKWRACLAVRGKRACLGYFASRSEAAEAYRLASTEANGEFAKPATRYAP